MSHYRISIGLAAILFACVPAAAQQWPARPVTMIVPYPAGGPTDSIGRIFAQQISESLGYPIVVENVVGAGGVTGANRIAQATPDGYQFLFVGSAMTYSQLLYKKPAFNSVTDFTPVALLTRQPLVLVARKDLPVKGLQELKTYLQANKDSNFGSAGIGSSSHLGCVMLNGALGLHTVHVPYRGVSAAIQDMIGGRIDYVCNLIQDVTAHIESGAVKPIAILSRSRSPILAGLATADEQGLSSLNVADWYGLFFPKDTPATIVNKLREAAGAALESPALSARLRALGVEIVPQDQRNAEYLADFLKQEIARWNAPIKASGVSVD